MTFVIALVTLVSGCGAMEMRRREADTRQWHAGYEQRVKSYLAQHPSRSKFREAMIAHQLQPGMNCPEADLVVRDYFEPEIHADSNSERVTWWVQPWGFIYFDHCYITRIAN